MFSTTAVALVGMPPCPAMGKQREVPATIGPPDVRVSISRWGEASNGSSVSPLLEIYPAASRIAFELLLPAFTHNWPPVPSLTVAPLAIAYSCVSKFTVEVAGKDWPFGNTVSQPFAE